MCGCTVPSFLLSLVFLLAYSQWLILHCPLLPLYSNKTETSTLSYVMYIPYTPYTHTHTNDQQSEIVVVVYTHQNLFFELSEWSCKTINGLINSNLHNKVNITHTSSIYIHTYVHLLYTSMHIMYIFHIHPCMYIHICT